MGQVIQDGQALFDDVVGYHAFDIDHKACTAGVVFKLGVVKTLFAGKSPLDGITLF